MKRLRFSNKMLIFLVVCLLSLITFLFRLVGAALCPPCTDGYAFAGLNSEVRATPDIIGSKANISFHNVQLCNEDIYDPSEPLSLPYNQSTAWTMVVGHNPSVSTDLYNVYVQTGWIRFNSTEHPPRNRVFLEMGTVVNGVHNPERWMLSTPLLSGTKEYKIEQTDKDAGEWTVYYDADSWGSEAKDYWESIVGKQARNKGEIHKLGLMLVVKSLETPLL